MIRLKASVAAVALLLAAAPAIAQVPSYQSPPLQRPTYAASAVGLAVPQTGAGDAVCLYGAANKTVRVKRIAISGTDSTAQTANVTLVKRSAANTGGTSTTPTIAGLDSSNSASAAVLRAYTGIPTPGAAVATVRSQSLPLPAASSATQYPPVIRNFGETNSQDLILRSAAEGVCVNFPAAFTTAGPSLNVDVTWTEQ